MNRLRRWWLERSIDRAAKRGDIYAKTDVYIRRAASALRANDDDAEALKVEALWYSFIGAHREPPSGDELEALIETVQGRLARSLTKL